MTALSVPPEPPPAVVPPAPTPEELRRRDQAAKLQRLIVMRRWATALLGFFAILFVVCLLLEPSHPWLAAVRATAEAAVVGGLADWFAVTALFRHPMGIPIPHTAVIPNQKDRIGRVLGNFVQNHFLSHDVVSSELRQLKLAERVAKWLCQPENSRRLATQVANGLAQVITALPEEEVRRVLSDSAEKRVQNTKFAPLLGNALALVTTDQQHQTLLNEALKLIGRVIEDNRDLIRDRIRDESPWWVPTRVDDAVYKKIIAGVEALIVGVRTDPNHPLRAKVDVALKDFIERLKTSPELAARAEQWKGQLLGRGLVDELVGSAWDAVQRAAGDYRGTSTAEPPEALVQGLSAAGRSMLENESLLAEVDDFIVRQAADVAERHRPDVAELFARVVARWDPSVAAERLELAVGSDLQYIRINGTLVGGLVGLLLYLLGTLR